MPKKRPAHRATLSDTRQAILVAAGAIMLEDGYAAVSARNVAKRAGIKPALLQYYFPTMDGLLLDLYRQAADLVAERQAEALASDHPIQALWELTADSKRTKLGVEFMGLANHRKAIRSEIAAYNERARSLQIKALDRALAGKLSDPALTPTVVSVMISAVARGLILEKSLGITAGHKQLQALIKSRLKELDDLPAPQAKKKLGTKRR